MNQRAVINLSRLVESRQAQVDRLNVELANKEAMRQRYHRNLQRIADLLAELGASGARAPALAANCAAYKAMLMNMISAHRNDLAVHEAEMAVVRRRLTALSLKCEVLVRSLVQKRRMLARDSERRKQKQQDQLAVQVWQQGRT